MTDQEIKAIKNAVYRSSHREELNRKQRERYANNANYREYQRSYGAEYWRTYERSSRAKSA